MVRAMLLAMLLAACGTGGATLTGTLTLTSDDLAGSDDNCSGTGGFGDIQQGMDVVIRDETGAIIGTSRVGPGTRSGRHCEFGFEVVELPIAEFYTVEVGDRGDLTYSPEELSEMDWHIDLTLGE